MTRNTSSGKLGINENWNLPARAEVDPWMMAQRKLR